MSKQKNKAFKVGTVALLGRPNTGKSTLVNNLIGQKVAITSPKPQTTQFSILAVYEDDGGQIVFVDTPGVFAKAENPKSAEVNLEAERALGEGCDVLLYLVDHTRERGFEENRVLGLARKLDVPKILVVNKIDKKKPTYLAQYRFMEDEFDAVVEISALRGTNLNILIEQIFEYLPEGEPMVDRAAMPVPVLNMDSRLYMEELIREKAFLTLRREVPYAVKVEVETIDERENGSLYVKAKILTLPRYKKMIIGESANRIKQIGMMSRKELEVSTNKKVFVDLSVETRKRL